MHVLLCDDDDALRSALRRLLERLGCHVTEASNGDEALRLQSTVSADVLLTDMLMPVKEGIETIRAFRKEYPQVRVIAMTGGGTGGAVTYLQLAQRLGAATVLPKPFTSEELARALGIPPAE
jgi:CheY-like chemotaxis protein